MHPNSACRQNTFFVHAAILHVHIWRWEFGFEYTEGWFWTSKRKTYHIYMHPNSACTQNTPGLYTLEPQFFMYAKHAWPTYTIDPIIYVRGTRLAYTRATTNWLTRRGARPTPLEGPPTILLRNNKNINQRPAYMHNVREALAAAPTLSNAQRSPQG